MRRLLLEGGVAGHLSHLYDNRQLTANKMGKILSLASKGELEGTEKTDGFNIYLGYRDGETRYARNKGDMRAGGRVMQDLLDRVFAGGDQIKDVYVKAFTAFGKFVERLPPNVQANIFGENGEIFYNTEIQGPGANNVVTYDANVVSIHHGNHKRYNPDTDTVEIVDAEANSKALDRVLNSIEQKVAGDDFRVARTAMMRLRRLDDDTDLRIVLAKIEKAGFVGDMTMEEYLVSKVTPQVEARSPHLNPAIHQMMVNYILNIPGEDGQKVKLNNIYKGFPVDQRKLIRNIVKEEGGSMVKKSIWPIETAIHDFAVELLRGMESAYILDNNSQVNRLKAEVESAIRGIQSYKGEGDDIARSVLAQQLEKIKHLDNINSTVEGFVFNYEGQMYKFTGNFAPINQILGLFKYGRGGVPAIKKQDSSEPEELDEMEEVPAGATETVVAVLPGAFKPPHRGHFAMALHYASIADSVKVYISRIPREGVDFNVSKAIWNMYVQGSSDPNASKIEVIPEPSDNSSPVGAALEYVGNEHGKPHLAQPGEAVILGASNKADKRGAPDFMRFKNAGKYFAPGVKGGDPDPSTGVPTLTVQNVFKVSPEALSASDLRKAIRNSDLKTVMSYMPKDVAKNETALQAIFDILDIGAAPSVDTPSISETLMAVVEEVLNEKLKPSQGAGAYVKDFYKSDAPQFKGKDKKKRREMAIAAFLQDKEETNEAVRLDESSRSLLQNPEYITNVLGIDMPLNESYPYSAQLNEQIVKEQMLLEGFFNDLKAMGGQAKQLFAALKELLTDPKRVQYWTNAAYRMMVKAPINKIYQLLNYIIEQLSTMPTIVQWAQKSKAMLQGIQQSVGNAKGWQGAMLMTSLGLGFKWLWSQVGEIIDGAVGKIGELVGAKAIQEIQKYIQDTVIGKAWKVIQDKFTGLIKQAGAALSGVGAWFKWASTAFQGAQFVLDALKGTLSRFGGLRVNELSAMAGGAVQGAAIDSDEGDTPWRGLDANKENKKQEKAQRLKGTKLTKEELIQKVMDYLLVQEKSYG